jgi:two-component system, OmpR family, phosphate regulon sensor histidine kinase PhoR
MRQMALYEEASGERGNAERGSRGPNPFRILWSGRAYGAALYFMLGLLVGYVYAYVLILLFQYRDNWPFALIILAALALTVCWWLTWMERGLAIWLLGTRFTPIAPPLPPGLSLWDQLKAHFRNPVAWKSLVYLAARLPAAMLGVAALALFAAALALVCVPVIVIGAMAAGSVGMSDLLVAIGFDPTMSWNLVYALSNGGAASVVFAVIAPVLGVLLWMFALWFFESVGRGWSWFARQMLGVSPTTLQLAEAQVLLAEARVRAERAEEDRRRLILDASHELRTPVATMRAYIDSLLLLEGERLDDILRQYLGVMQREAERLGLLVDDLLMLARADAAELRLDVRPAAVAGVVEEVYRAMAPLAERERQVTLVRQIAEDAPSMAYADRSRLAQALMNLVRNAITHTPAGGLVSIDLAPGESPDTLALTVTDTGDGIADEDLPHLFERFYRADAARARDTGGFGLGLSIVRDLIEAMGGSVSAGRAPEGGARFQITLRAAGSPASVA